MQEIVTYDKVYLDESYKQEFAALRDRYHERTRKALQGRSVDHEPVSNVSEFFYLNDDGNGGVTLTAGDFVAYFNNRFGGGDRLDAMKRSIRQAVSREELCREKKTARINLSQSKQRSPKITFAERIRSAQRKFSFVHAVFALMLTLSLVLMLGSSIVLDRAEQEVATLEQEVGSLWHQLDERAGGAGRDTAEGYGLVAGDAEAVSYLELSGEDTVEIYPSQKGVGVEMSGLLNAIAALLK